MGEIYLSYIPILFNFNSGSVVNTFASSIGLAKMAQKAPLNIVKLSVLVK